MQTLIPNASQVSQHTHSYTFDALLCVASLRRTGSSLPVELWHQAIVNGVSLVA